MEDALPGTHLCGSVGVSRPSLSRWFPGAGRVITEGAGKAAAGMRAAAAAAASGRGAVPPAPPASPGLRLTRSWMRSRSPLPPPAPRPAQARAAAARIAARGSGQCAGAAACSLARPRGPRGSKASAGVGATGARGLGSAERAGRGGARRSWGGQAGRAAGGGRGQRRRGIAKGRRCCVHDNRVILQAGRGERLEDQELTLGAGEVLVGKGDRGCRAERKGEHGRVRGRRRAGHHFSEGSDWKAVC